MTANVQLATYRLFDFGDKDELEAKWGAATADRLVVYNQYNNKQQTIVHRITTTTMLAK